MTLEPQDARRNSSNARCPLYLPGHNVHFIQFRLTWNEPQHDPIPAKLLEVRDDGELTLDLGGELRRYWNHSPDDVARALSRSDGELELVGYGVLKVARRFHRRGQGIPVFCVTETDSEFRYPCTDPDDPLPADPIDRLMETGGFVMSGPEALRWAEQRERGAEPESKGPSSALVIGRPEPRHSPRPADRFVPRATPFGGAATMERLDELHRATLVDRPWQPLRGAVLAERRMIAATLTDSVPVGNRRGPRTPPAPPPRPSSSTPQSERRAPEPATSDPLEQLARG